MTVRTVRVFKYDLPLHEPLSFGNIVISTREGFLVELESDSGQRACGEVVSLPWLSGPTTVELEQELITFASQKIDAESLSSSSAFGISVANRLLDIKEKRTRYYGSWAGTDDVEIKLNALIMSSQNDIPGEAQRLLENGYSSIKIKVGRQSLDEDIERVRRLHELVHGKGLIRIDANQAFSLNQALKFCDAVGSCCIEYLEEPVENPHELAILTAYHNMPFAFDESLASVPVHLLNSLPRVPHWIIKPSCLGSLDKIDAIINCAHAQNIKCTISSSFESGIGLSALALIAADYSPHIHAGLSTFTAFTRDLAVPAFVVPEGRVSSALCRDRLIGLKVDNLLNCRRIF